MHMQHLWRTILIGLIFFLSFAGIAFGEDLMVTMLNVGQADAILVQTNNKTVLIDAGEQKTDVAEQLKAKGINYIDLVVATHPHADHIGGMNAVVSDFSIKTYMDNGFPHTASGYNQLMETANSKVASGQMKYLVARQGQTLNLSKEARFEVLWPNNEGLSGTRSDINANSVVMKLTHGDVCFMFMGDAEAETEKIVADQIKAPCQVLKVSHHGSKHSSIPELINKLKPEVALISCGLANKHGHPGQSTLDNLTALGTHIFRTDLMGELTVVSNGKSVSVATEHAAIKLTKININLADASVLRQLPGVGEKTANQIIEYRETHGPFTNVNDVLNIASNDMNRKRIEKIIPFITVSGGSTTGLIDEGGLAENIYPSSITTPPLMLKVVPMRSFPKIRVVIPAYHHHVLPGGSQSKAKSNNAGSQPQAKAPQANAPQATAPKAMQPGAQSGKVNINTADLAALAGMPGMSAKKAQAAIDHRNEKGPFKSCNALVDVKGIGKKTVEKLLSVCTVE